VFAFNGREIERIMAAILIIEDEHALGNALALAVRRLGHLPSLAASGGAALKMLGERNFEAIVLDIGLPDVSGLVILEKIRANGSKIPVLIISAHATLDHTITSRKLGIAVDVIVRALSTFRGIHRRLEVVARDRGITVRSAAEPAFTTLSSAAKRPARAWLTHGRVVAMTPRALARFQGVPDSYLLPDRKALACRVIGNGVAVDVARVAVETLL
jgi:DNA-binding response OmpR family regulator